MSEAGWNTPPCQGKCNIWQAKLFISNVIPTRGRRKSNPGGRYDPRFGCDFLGWVLSERWGKWYLEWARLLASKTLISLTGMRVNNATHESTPELYTHTCWNTYPHTHITGMNTQVTYRGNRTDISKTGNEKRETKEPSRHHKKIAKLQLVASAYLKLVLLVFGALVERAVIAETPDVVDFVEALDVVRNAIPLEDVLAVWDWSYCVDLQVWVRIVSRSVTERCSGPRMIINRTLKAGANTEYEIWTSMSDIRNASVHLLKSFLHL